METTPYKNMAYDQNKLRISYESYKFEGELVTISSHVNFSDHDLLFGSAWFLQLWTQNKVSGSQALGFKVAQIEIFPGVGQTFFEGVSPVMWPATNDEQTLAIALAEQTIFGDTEIREIAVFSKTERFISPQIAGEINLNWREENLSINIEAIVNPRDENNISGTLNLELWSLAEKYNGGSWLGVQHGIMPIGVISGGSEITPPSFHVSGMSPTTNEHVTLMLREWTVQGFVTRDYREIACLQNKTIESNNFEKKEPTTFWDVIIRLFR